MTTFCEKFNLILSKRYAGGAECRVDRENESDRGRLRIFIETLISGLKSRFPTESAEDGENELVQRLAPANLREALDDLPLSDTCQEWKRNAA